MMQNPFSSGRVSCDLIQGAVAAAIWFSQLAKTNFSIAVDSIYQTDY